MGAINNAYNQAGWSILQLASAASKYISGRNKEGQNKAKQGYNWAATIKKQNDELTKTIAKKLNLYFGDTYSDIPPERDEQKIAEQEVLEKMKQEKTKAASFGGIPTASSEIDEQKIAEEKPKPKSFGEILTVNPENDEQKITDQKVLEQIAEEKTKAASSDELPTVSAEHSETNISANDPEVQGLINVKQKNALRAASSKRSQERYQKIKAKLTSVFADYSNIDDVWREISLAPDITDEMIRKAGFTKTQILEEWKNFKDSPTDWMAKQNMRGEEYGLVGGNETDAEDFSNFDFGGMLSTYIRAKIEGKTWEQKWEEHELGKAEEEPSVDDWYLNFDRDNNTMSNSDTYKVWQDDSTEDDSTEEEKDEEKKDKIIF